MNKQTGNNNSSMTKRLQQSRGKRNRSNSTKETHSSSDDVDVVSIQIERYDRLFYNAHRQLHKQIKQIKSFLVQKEIRKIKQQKQNRAKKDRVNMDGNSSRASVQSLKELDLEMVTQQALRQLGLYHCNPRLKINKEDTRSNTNQVDSEGGDDHNKKDNLKKTNNDDSIEQEIPQPLTTSHPDHMIVSIILTHKRFINIMEEWNNKVTEYRRWCIQMDVVKQKQDNDGNNDDDIDNIKKRKKNIKMDIAVDDYRANLQETMEESTALFCTLATRHDDDLNGTVKKKNRKGQRARKAKAMALQAKQENRKAYTSMNWRAAATNRAENDDQIEGKKGQIQNWEAMSRNDKRTKHYEHTAIQERGSSKSVDAKKALSYDAAEHPSWVAKQAQKVGIVPFQGKKITFD